MRGKGALSNGLTWAGFAGLGAVGGLLLGNFVVGHDVTDQGEHGSYADATGNPEALGITSSFGEPCYDCGPGYGRATPRTAASEGRMTDAFRELGAVEMDEASSPVDDYSYGGRFDDPAAARDIAVQAPVPSDVAAPAPDTSPIVATSTPAPANEPPPGLPAQ